MVKKVYRSQGIPRFPSSCEPHTRSLVRLKSRDSSVNATCMDTAKTRVIKVSLVKSMDGLHTFHCPNSHRRLIGSFVRGKHSHRTMSVASTGSMERQPGSPPKRRGSMVLPAFVDGWTLDCSFAPLPWNGRSFQLVRVAIPCVHCCWILNALVIAKEA